jgi:hypothetical protein
MVVVAVMLIAASQAVAPAVSPPSQVPELPVNVEHVREALQRPGLKIPSVDPTPVFRATVEVDLPLDSPLQAMRRELTENSGYRGRSGVDILAAVMGMVKSIKSARRAHAEVEIRKEVQAELDAFCAEHDCSVLEDGPPPLEGIVLPRKAR